MDDLLSDPVESMFVMCGQVCWVTLLLVAKRGAQFDVLWKWRSKICPIKSLKREHPVVTQEKGSADWLGGRLFPWAGAQKQIRGEEIC